jgi:hypothetical protein
MTTCTDGEDRHQDVEDGRHQAGIAPSVATQKVISFLIAPTARLLGYRSWYRDYSLK